MEISRLLRGRVRVGIVVTVLSMFCVWLAVSHSSPLTFFLSSTPEPEGEVFVLPIEVNDGPVEELVDPIFRQGHEASQEDKIASKRVAFLLPSTTKKTSISKLDQLPLFSVLLPSLFETIPKPSKEFSYEFYLGMPEGDAFYDRDSSLEEISLKFAQYEKEKGVPMRVKFFFMGDYTSGRLTWIWNYLANEALHDGCDFFYQFGDDVRFLTPWVKEFVSCLENNPVYPGLGVCGATDEGNERTITQGFVSRVHFEIFGGVYPSTIKNWFSDDYLTHVYGFENTFWFRDVRLKNTNVFGQRYQEQGGAEFLTELITDGGDQIAQYLREKGAHDKFVWEKHFYHWDSNTHSLAKAETSKKTLQGMKDKGLIK